MYSFDGQYRRKPVQSLGGASRKEEKNLLILRTQEERKRREELRHQQSSATHIQAFYRGYKVRQKLKAAERSKFDFLRDKQTRNVATLDDTLFVLWRRLLFFYDHDIDGQRLTWLCQLCIKNQASVLQQICKQPTLGVHNIQNLLWLCCRNLQSIATSSMPLAIPLRMLEIYTLPESYARHTPKPQADVIVHNILSYLINRGYYKCMRVLIEQKIPASIEHTIVPPTPMAATVLELVKKPLAVVNKTDNPKLRNEVLQSLFQELFSPQHMEQTRYFILPALSAGKESFPFQELLGALTKCVSVPIQCSVATLQLTIDGSIWLLYTVLNLGQKHIEHLSVSDLGMYLGVLHQLSSHLQITRSKYANMDDDDSDDEFMDTDEYAPNSVAEVQRVCIQLIDEPIHVRCLLSFIKQQPNPANMLAICSLCHVFMAEQKQAMHKTRLLYSLAFSPWFLHTLWQTCITVTINTVTGSKMALIQMLSGGLNMSNHYLENIVPLVSVFSSLFTHSLFSLHDAEFYGDSTTEGKTHMPFKVHELSSMSQVLRDVCLGIIELAHPDTKPMFRASYSVAFNSVGVPNKNYTEQDLYRQRETWAYLFKVISQLIKQLYTRDSRRRFCAEGHWLASRVNIMADKPLQIYTMGNEAFQRRPFGSRSALNPNRLMEEDGPPMSTMEVRNITVLTELPFVVSFQERVKILQKLLNLDYTEHQRDSRHFSVGPMINITVRRNYLYEDAFEKLSPENESNLKLRIQVQLKNFQGLDEAGIDGGGIFREFMTELIKTAFDPNRGFFKSTNDKLLYPSPQAKLLIEDYTKHYFFLGRILGKALYENMLIELPFASFFLNKILSRHGGDVDIHQLASLDPEMYKNLLFLKDFEGDVSDLGLDFTVVNNDLGEAQIVELKHGGRDITVTNHNRIEYIHLMADYRLNKQIRAHCQAFRQGLADVINIDWLRMFDHNELQVLISGAPVPIDIGDLRRHTNYSGGYGEDHPIIVNFWRIVETFTDEQKRYLLKFVTSCSRPPLLGFKELYPAFCIQYGGSERDRLPTASTCMNLLKLPEFKDESLMKEKLLYAIESGAGFELS